MKIFTKDHFLFPTIGKLILTAALFFAVGWIIWPFVIESIMTDWYPVGFPFAIYAGGFCPPTYSCIDFSWSALVIDIVIWYFVSAGLLKQFRKKT